MSRTTLATLLTTVVVALNAASASAQVNFFEPSSWFAPRRPCYGPNCPPNYATRPVITPNVYPNYGGPVTGGSFYRGSYGNKTICPDDICGPRNGWGGYRTAPAPRYPVVPMPYNAPQPSNCYYAPLSGYNSMDRRVTPTNYEDDAWTVTRSARPSRSFESNSNPFYP
jgi:hypothetical protein